MKPKQHWYYFLFVLPFYLLAILPQWIFYGLIDVLRFFVYHVFRYRREVVLNNLRNSFPNQDEKWIHKTAWAFYRNLLDTAFETIRIAAMPQDSFARHVKFERGVIEDLGKRGKPFILVCGHLANYEWAGQALHASGTQVDVLYHPLSNSFFDWFIYRCRSRHGIYPIPMQSALREMVNRKNIPSAITFIADQTPSSEGCHWMTFLHQDTPVFLGVEKLARRFNYPVVYGEMRRLGRGQYEMEFKMLFEKPLETRDFDITETHMHELERGIRVQPEDWLWSHRRWKHRRKIVEIANV